MLLEKFREQARRAYYHTSFSPDQRAKTCIEQHSAQLAADMEKIEQYGADPEEYRQKYERLFYAWLSARGRCISSMITGPSNFPVRRAEKANRSEENKYRQFQEWREWSMTKARRAKQREERANSYPSEDMRQQIAKAERNQEKMREVNKIIRKKVSDEKKIAAIVEMGFSAGVAAELLKPDFCGRIGFAAYQLTNNNANIHRMRERLAELEKRAQRETAEKETESGVKIVENAEDDRLQLFFPGKPEPAKIELLKRHGFKWSPKNGCWQRQLTDNAKYTLKHYIINNI